MAFYWVRRSLLLSLSCRVSPWKAGQGDRTTKRLQRGAGVVDAVAIHGTQDAKLVGVPGHVREQFADRQTGLAVLLKLERRGQHFVAGVTEM